MSKARATKSIIEKLDDFQRTFLSGLGNYRYTLDVEGFKVHVESNRIQYLIENCWYTVGEITEISIIEKILKGVFSKFEEISTLIEKIKILKKIREVAEQYRYYGVVLKINDKAVFSLYDGSWVELNPSHYSVNELLKIEDDAITALQPIIENFKQSEDRCLKLIEEMSSNA